MKLGSNTYFPFYFTRSSIIVFIISIFLCTIIFMGNHLPGLWLIFAISEVLFFFYFAAFLSRKWQRIQAKQFIQNIFWLSLILRITWVVFSYFFFLYQTGIPFGFHAADALSYHHWAETASDKLLEKGFQQFFDSSVGISDMGFPMYLTIIYFLFGNYVIIPRLINTILNSFTVVLIYKLARRNFGESAGRIAAVMAMLLPNFIYYCGLHLKEPLMILLVVAYAERADALLRMNPLKLKSILTVAILAYLLFYFRTVIGITAIFALFTSLLFASRQFGNVQKRMITSGWILIFVFIFFSSRISGEVNYMIQNTDIQQTNLEWRAVKEGGNTLATYGRAAIFVPFIFVVPFPTFVSIEMQEQQMLLSGANFIRNIYAFFAMLAIYMIYRRKLLRKYIFLLTFLLVYFAVLAKSSFAISERFHLPAVPFLLIFASYGINTLELKYKKLFTPYVIILIVIIVGWNWFKLAGRGLV